MFIDMLVWIILGILVLASFIGMSFLKNFIFNNLLKDMQNQNFEKLFKRLDSFIVKLLYAPYDREYMRLNAYFLMGDEKKIRKQFDIMFTKRMNKKQNFDISIKAFYFYIDDGNKLKVREMLDRVQKYGNEEFYTQCKIMYDVVIEKSDTYINDMEKQIKQCEGIDRGMYHYLLGLQYMNKKDTKNALNHLHSAQKDLKGSPYELKIKQAIKDVNR